MFKYAVIDESVVINIINADSKEIAEKTTGKICIEFSSQNAETGGTWDGVKFLPKKPYPSWVLNADDVWVAPVPYPKNETQEPTTVTYVWDEESISWVESAL